MATQSFLGKGVVKLGVGGATPTAIGNCSKLSLNVSEEVIEMSDYENGGGGLVESISRIKSVGVEINAYSFSSDNLAIALRGAVTVGVDDDTIECLTSAALDYKLVFEGLNEARSNKAVTVTLYRVQFSPTKGLDLIGDKFAELSLTGKVLKDTTITGAGKSQYMKIVVAH